MANGKQLREQIPCRRVLQGPPGEQTEGGAKRQGGKR
jgi:hypothetical protein